MTRILTRHQAVLRRPIETGFYNDSGEYVNTNNYLIKPIRGSIQPIPKSAFRQINESEGLRMSDCRVMYTTTPLIAADDITGINSDTIIYSCTEYEVIQSDPWDAIKRLSHYRVILKRRDRAKRLFN